jgi:pilus assembly protein Flp/PilA
MVRPAAKPRGVADHPGWPTRGGFVGTRVQRKELVMRKFTQSVVEFLKREDGPTAVEYAVMLALIIVVCITAITAIGTNANAVFNNVASNMTTAS